MLNHKQKLCALRYFLKCYYNKSIKMSLVQVITILAFNFYTKIMCLIFCCCLTLAVPRLRWCPEQPLETIAKHFNWEGNWQAVSTAKTGQFSAISLILQDEKATVWECRVSYLRHHEVFLYTGNSSYKHLLINVVLVIFSFSYLVECGVSRCVCL